MDDFDEPRSRCHRRKPFIRAAIRRFLYRVFNSMSGTSGVPRLITAVAVAVAALAVWMIVSPSTLYAKLTHDGPSHYLADLLAASEPAISGTTGSLFKGYPTVPLPAQAAYYLKTPSAAKPITLPTRGFKCKQWAVVTTIFEPSESVLDMVKRPDWCTVVAADTKTPVYDIKSDRLVVLDVAKQKELTNNFPDLFSLLPWRHFGRKNVGFLYAIMHGAEMVWDFDDDNLLKEGASLDPPESITMLSSSSECPAINIYPLMGGPPSSWPRGFPLDTIKHPCELKRTTVPTSKLKVGVYQSLADNEPDVDALYRLTQGTPFDFDTSAKTSFGISSGGLTPYNAQATLIMQPALWSLLLPVSVHGRVSDIWRSYIAQRIMWDTGHTLVFTPPRVTQYRNPHNFLADMKAEEDLYYKASRLSYFLRHWRSPAPTVPERVMELTTALYTRGYIGLRDVVLTHEWMRALVAVGYKFPAVRDCVVKTGGCASPSPPGWVSTAARRTFWTADNTDSLRADVASVLTEGGHTVFLASRKGRAGLPSSVASNGLVKLPTKAIPYWFKPTADVTEWAAQSMFSHYKGDSQIARVDAFVCGIPAGHCETWMSFNKTLIFYAANRYAVGHCSTDKWTALNQRLVAADQRGHIVVAAGKYDAEYINYFTGLTPTVIPALSLARFGRGAAPYAPTRPEILLGPVGRPGFKELAAMNAGGRFKYVPMGALYDNVTPQALASHRAVVLLPHALSAYELADVYAAAVPIFVPAPEFLMKLGLPKARAITDAAYCGAKVKPPAKAEGSKHIFSPEAHDAASIKYWLGQADVYTTPHITTFTSWEDLDKKLAATDLYDIHEKMVEENEKREATAAAAWGAIAKRIPVGGAMPASFEAGLAEGWDITKF